MWCTGVLRKYRDGHTQKVDLNGVGVSKQKERDKVREKGEPSLRRKRHCKRN